MTSRKNKHKNCGSPDHRIHRRLFLQGTASAAGAVATSSFAGLFTNPAIGDGVRKRAKRCLLLWLCGAPSQFETWDPKPGRPTGGPFGVIDTNLLGVKISELMPKSSRRLNDLAIVRSMSTEPSEHFQAIDVLTRGEKPRPPFTRPILGSVVAQLMGELESPVPQFVLLDPCPEGNEFKAFKAGNWSGWLGADFAPVRVGGEFKIENSLRPEMVGELDQEDRESIRRLVSKRYENLRRSSLAGAHNTAFERVKGMMKSASLFDLERIPEAERARFGHGAFAQHALLARHLLENGSTFVMVANGMPWDCHVMNHEIHQMLVPELDHVIDCLVEDLKQRGMWEDTLLIAMGEFGRTPTLNDARGRDHYPKAWSMAMGGCGIRGGVVYGATDENGVAVSENPIDNRRLFATIFHALGIDHNVEYGLPGFPAFHRVEGKVEPIREILTA